MRIESLLIVLLSSSVVAAQTVKQGNIKLPRPTVAAKGHYKHLQNYPVTPTNIDADKKHFPLETMRHSYFNNLKLRAVYVDVPIEIFDIGSMPANSSIQTKKELEYLHGVADTSRNKEKIEESLKFANIYYRVLAVPSDTDYTALRKNLFHIGRQLGNWFNPDSLPITANFMAKVWQDATYYCWALKFKYNRIRPYQLDTTLKQITNPNFPAYPSGHSTNSYVAAYVYSELLPQFTELFTRNAFDMAFSREMLGVHFPSDTESGRLLARQLVNLFLQSNSFKKDLLKAKTEIKKIINRNDFSKQNAKH
ncbi:MAG: phosphatase PAP2 family protein [Chitinophagaceae bacterium]